MFAASQGPIINLDAIPWHWIVHVLMVLAFVFMLIVCIGVVIAVARSKGGVKKVVKAVEADVAAVASTPAGKTIIADAEAFAAAVARKLQASPAVDIPNHPAITALADELQKSKAAQEALAKVASLTQQATAAATAPAAK